MKKNAADLLRAKGRAALAKAKEKLTNVSENVLDLGDALIDLAAPGVAKALRRDSFEAICAEDLHLHPQTARRWMALATRLRREFVLHVGVERSRALMELADATPADDLAEDVYDATLSLPSGKKLVVRSASVAELDAAAQEFRQVKTAATEAAGRKVHGFTTSVAERKAFAPIEKRLRKAPKGAHAAARLVAQRDADGAKVVLEVRLAAWDATLDVLRGK
jgi:hypothetical protein